MYDKYSIKSGETLNQVAKRFNTNVDVLKSINNIYYDEQTTYFSLFIFCDNVGRMWTDERKLLCEAC